MKKGLHVIRALYPELSGMCLCRWCGEDIESKRGDWLGTYTPKLEHTEHGRYQLCFTCALRCSELQGQPRVTLIFGSQFWRGGLSL